MFVIIYHCSKYMLVNFVEMKLDKKKYVKAWLYCGLLMIFLILIVGGITRLTDSGLSMTHWHPIGDLPTYGNIESSYILWIDSPQGKHLSYDFDKFKFIYFWEYLHRLLARSIGLIFIIPFIFFILKRWINPNEVKRYSLLLILGAMQALIGWWMVRSGLDKIPHVSHFRLAIHFINACAILGVIWWYILDLNFKIYEEERVNRLSKIFLSIFIIQLIYGAFTAGLKAGMLINQGNYLKTIFGYFNPQAYQNIDILNNMYNIQLIHRGIAWILFLLAGYLFTILWRTKLRKVGIVLFISIMIQIGLGILTLITKINIYSAIIHQSVACFILLIIIYLIHTTANKTIEKTQ